MPTSPRKPCNAPGCGTLVEHQQRFCSRHHKQHQQQKDQNRKTAAQRGYGGRWQRSRKHYLQSNPLCINCKAAGKITQATVVDHITPHKGNMRLFWDQKNWQPLCETCHNRKTAKEDGGFGRNSASP